MGRSIHDSKDTRGKRRQRDALEADMKSKGIFSDDVDWCLERDRKLDLLRKAYKESPKRTLAWFNANKTLMDELNIKTEDFIGDKE